MLEAVRMSGIEQPILVEQRPEIDGLRDAIIMALLRKDYDYAHACSKSINNLINRKETDPNIPREDLVAPEYDKVKVI